MNLNTYKRQSKKVGKYEITRRTGLKAIKEYADKRGLDISRYHNRLSVYDALGYTFYHPSARELESQYGH